MNPPHRFDGRIRAFAPDDAEAAARIYGHYVLNGTATFEETPPSPENQAPAFRGGAPLMEAVRPSQNPQVTPIQGPRSKVRVSRSSALEPWSMMLKT